MYTHGQTNSVAISRSLTRTTFFLMDCSHQKISKSCKRDLKIMIKIRHLKYSLSELLSSMLDYYPISAMSIIIPTKLSVYQLSRKREDSGANKAAILTFLRVSC